MKRSMWAWRWELATGVSFLFVSIIQAQEVSRGSSQDFRATLRGIIFGVLLILIFLRPVVPFLRKRIRLVHLVVALIVWMGYCVLFPVLTRGVIS
ncbi:MAG: hypothetical protein V1809_01070 [Planctomycetota bacterium]